MIVWLSCSPATYSEGVYTRREAVWFESLWAEREPTWTTCLTSDSRSNTSIRAEQWPWKSTQQTHKDAVIMMIRTDSCCVFIINRLKRVSRLKRWFSRICRSLLWPRPLFPKCLNVFLLQLHAHFFTMTMRTCRCVTSKISGVHKRLPPSWPNCWKTR